MRILLPFPSPTSDKNALEEGDVFSPKFDANGLITCVTCAYETSEVLMVAHMNAEALKTTLKTKLVHYWSRSRGTLWLKGETSGQIQHLIEARVDCDQDAILLKVRVDGDGGACHTGRHTCFYRKLELD